MLEVLRKKPICALMLRCVRCGATQGLEDDGSRTRHAKFHQASCTDAPEGMARLELVSGDHLKVHAPDDSLWFEIVRTVNR
jgi:hypothetical protein